MGIHTLQNSKLLLRPFNVFQPMLRLIPATFDYVQNNIILCEFFSSMLLLPLLLAILNTGIVLNEFRE